MGEVTDFLMQDGCPWVDLRKWSGVPNIRWCEDQVCAWIATPANTWSNLGYVFVGFYFFWLTRKEKSENLRFYGVAAQWVGWTSFIYHASLAFATQVLDFLGMFIFFYLVLIQNLARLGYVRDDKIKRTVWIATLITTALASGSQYFGFPVQVLVVILIAGILGTELWASMRSATRARHRAFAASLFFLGIGAVFSAADLSRKFCTPGDHWIQGHALWHYFGAIALYFSLLHSRQFYSAETGRLVGR